MSQSKALTDRERDVLRLLADDCPVAEMARRLGISPGTVRSRMRSALSKLGDGPASQGGGGRRGRTAESPEAAHPAGASTRRLLARAIIGADRRAEALSVVGLEVSRRAEDGGAAEAAALHANLARVVAAGARRSDVVGSWDPEGLLVVLPGTGLSGARAAADRLRRRVGNQAACLAVALERAPGERVTNLLSRVRQALQDERVRREVGRTLWLQTSRPQ